MKSASRSAAVRRLPASESGDHSRENRDSQLLLPALRPMHMHAAPETPAEPKAPKAPVPASPNAITGPRPAPEESELRQKRSELAMLQAELTRKELRLANLRADLVPFEARYVRRIGVRCARLDEAEARIAEIEAARDPENPAAQDAARRARARADRSRAAVLRHNSAGAINQPTAVKRLYRAVARRVHPDFSQDPGDQELRERLMAHANSAYKHGNERRLRGILNEYEFRPEGVKGDGTPLELVRVIRGIALVRGRLEEIEEEAKETRSSDLYRFKERVEAAAKRGRNLIAEVAAAVDTRIAAARRKLKHLSSSPAAR